MKIQKCGYALSFGKEAVMTCEVKRRDTNKRTPATLYKMNPKLYADRQEVNFSKHARCISQYFTKEISRHYPVNDYFLLKDDNSDEVISAAMSSHHYKTGDNTFNGYTTLVSEYEDNIKYVSPLEPVFAYMVKTADRRFDDTVSVGFYSESIPFFKSLKFSQIKNGDWVIPKKRYDDFLDRAEKRFNIDFLV